MCAVTLNNCQAPALPNTSQDNKIASLNEISQMSHIHDMPLINDFGQAMVATPLGVLPNPTNDYLCFSGAMAVCDLTSPHSDNVSLESAFSVATPSKPKTIAAINNNIAMLGDKIPTIS